MYRIESAARPPRPVDDSNFVLPGTMQRVLAPDDGQDVRLYRVRFEEGARTYWHRHDDVQLLFGLGGTCVVVDRDGTELLLGEGDLVVIEADLEHWHGAAPGTFGEHLAVNLGEVTTWLESSD